MLFRAACELGGARGRRRGAPARPGPVRRADRAGLPAARRHPRRLGPAGADGQAARRRPARRHGHAAADPRARARPGAGERLTCARFDTPGARRRGLRPDRRHRRAGGHAGARAGAGGERQGGAARDAGASARGAGARRRRRRRALFVGPADRDRADHARPPALRARRFRSPRGG